MKKEDIDMIDNGIYNLLFNRDSPERGLTVRQMTRRIFGYGEGDEDDAPVTDELFYTRAKLVERRIGAIRHKIFAEIRRKMKEQREEDEKRGVQRISMEIERPKFIPYALPVGKYWKYLNAANYQQMPWVIKGLRKKADGLNANAEVLEAVF